mmetsp:Transcript_37253/g.86906  ORF Transcript_37253/g.86906 Transcript_37253/m.86906 type:complete len:812 (-) Transcript_37253:133-2568(-)
MDSLGDSSASISEDSNGFVPVGRPPKATDSGSESLNLPPGRARRRRRRDGQAGIRRRLAGGGSSGTADLAADCIITAKEKSEEALKELEQNEEEAAVALREYAEAVEKDASTQIEQLEKDERVQIAARELEDSIVSAQAEEIEDETEVLVVAEHAMMRANEEIARIEKHEQEVNEERVRVTKEAEERSAARYQAQEDEQIAADIDAMGDVTEMLVARESIRLKAEQKERVEMEEKKSVSSLVQQRAAAAAAAMKSQRQYQSRAQAAAMRKEEKQFLAEERRKQKEYDYMQAREKAEEERKRIEEEERKRQQAIQEERDRIRAEERRKAAQRALQEEEEKLKAEEERKADEAAVQRAMEEAEEKRKVTAEEQLRRAEEEQDITGGPMWLAAQKLLIEDELYRKEEEDLQNESFKKRRQKVPANLRKVDIRASINAAGENAERRAELKKKKQEVAGSLLSRAVSRNDQDSEVVPTAVAPSLFRAVDGGSVLGAVEDENMPQSHGVINAKSMGGNGESRNAMVKIVDDDAIVQLTPQMARKRTRVFQLFCIGLAVLIFGFFGAVYTLTSCNFTSTDVIFGDDDYQNNQMDIHYGLWKYSPLDSAFDGYPYCIGYFENEFGAPPKVASVASLLSVLFGFLALAVMWYYLITCVTHYLAWEIASVLFVLSGLLQSCTFLFFKSDICEDEDHNCVIGPGATASIFATFMWFVGAAEMHLNKPLQAMRQQAQSRAAKLLQMEQKSHKKVTMWNRVQNLVGGGEKVTREKPSLSAYAKKNEKMKYRSDMYHGMGRGSSLSMDSYGNGSGSKGYDPPEIV